MASVVNHTSAWTASIGSRINVTVKFSSLLCIVYRLIDHELVFKTLLISNILEGRENNLEN